MVDGPTMDKYNWFSSSYVLNINTNSVRSFNLVAQLPFSLIKQTCQIHIQSTPHEILFLGSKTEAGLNICNQERVIMI
jgi:hypothetical protein